jgi:hypothetical protein
MLTHLQRLLLRDHLYVLPFLVGHKHLVLVHELRDERVLAQDLAPQDRV